MVFPPRLDPLATVAVAATGGAASGNAPDTVADAYLGHLFGNIYFIAAALLLVVGLLALFAIRPDMIAYEYDEARYGKDVALLKQAYRDLDENTVPKKEVPGWLMAWVLLAIPAVVAAAYFVDPAGFMAYANHLIIAYLTPRNT